MAKQWIEEFFGDGTREYVEFRNPPKVVVEQLKKSTGQNTYPFIYCGDTFIGGYSELNNYFKITKLLDEQFNIKIEDNF